MEESSSLPSARSIGMKYGLILGVISIGFTIVIDMMGLVGNQAIQYGSLIISAGIVFLAHKEFKDTGDGFMNYGEGFSVGAWTSVISALLSSVFLYIYITMINPGYLDVIKEQQVIALEERGMSDAEIDQALEVASFFTKPEMITLFGLLGGVFFGIIVALIISAFTKNSRPELS
ncbi:MAG: DUF4199 domain-containing protein [Cyclobacteriaceae bacterium]